MARDIPLKEKYLTRKPTGFKSHSNNSGKRTSSGQGEGPRRVNYGPFWWLNPASQRPIGS